MKFQKLNIFGQLAYTSGKIINLCLFQELPLPNWLFLPDFELYISGIIQYGLSGL